MKEQRWLINMRCCNCEGKAEFKINDVGICLPCFYAKFRFHEYPHGTMIEVLNQDTVLNKFLDEVI